MRLVTFFILLFTFTGFAYSESTKMHILVDSKSVAYDVLDAGPDAPIVILLPGTSGPSAPYYQERASHLQKSGFTVLVLHYFDAAFAIAPSNQTYAAWVRALQALVEACRANPQYSKRKIGLVGYSLGASIALAAGSQRIPVDAIAEWYGSLPDSFFHALQGMPPLLILHGEKDTNIPVLNAKQLIRLCELAKFQCESHLYAGQSHGFTDSALADAEKRTIAFFRVMLA